MSNIYRAILTGDRLQWAGDAPDVLRQGHSIPVYVTIPSQASDVADSERGTRMAAILEQIANLPAAVQIEDPVAWQRELREERSLDRPSS